MHGLCAVTKDHLTSVYMDKLKVLACHSKGGETNGEAEDCMVLKADSS